MKKNFLSNIICLITGFTIASTAAVLAATYTATENAFPIKINGTETAMEGYNINGSTYFKLRDIGDRMGFNVDFQDNTIYIGEVPTVKNNEVKYYSEKPWCPDFGAATGAKLIETKKSDNMISYKYSILFDGNISDYYDLIVNNTNLKLNPASLASFVTFENLDTGHSISCMLNDKDYTVTIIVE